MISTHLDFLHDRKVRHDVSCDGALFIATTPWGHAITEPRGGEKGLGSRKWSWKTLENTQKTFSFRFRSWKVRRPFRSSFISIINSLEWFSELQYLKNILEINAGHFEAKRYVFQVLTDWKPCKYKGHEKIRSIQVWAADKHRNKAFQKVFLGLRKPDYTNFYQTKKRPCISTLNYTLCNNSICKAKSIKKNSNNLVTVFDAILTIRQTR